MGLFDRFLNRIDTAGGVPILDRSNPLDWSRLAQTIVFSVVATVSLAYQTVITALTDAYAAVLTGLSEFAAGRDAPGILDPQLRDAASEPGIVQVIASEATQLIAAVWSNAFTNVPGFLRLPVQVAVLLAAFWVLTQGIVYIRDEVI